MDLPILEEVVRAVIPPFSQATNVLTPAEEVVERVLIRSAPIPRIIQATSTSAAATAREARMFGKIGNLIEFCLSKTRSVGAVVPRNCWWIGGGLLTLVVGGLFFSSCLRRDVVNTTVLPNPNPEKEPTNVIYTPFQDRGYRPDLPKPRGPANEEPDDFPSSGPSSPLGPVPPYPTRPPRPPLIYDRIEAPEPPSRTDLPPAKIIKRIPEPVE